MIEPECRWRGKEVRDGIFQCSSAKLVVFGEGVTIDRCAKCYCRDHEPLSGERAQFFDLKKIRGMGDLLAAILKRVGVKAKPGCGCKARQERLNALFPRRIPTNLDVFGRLREFIRWMF